MFTQSLENSPVTLFCAKIISLRSEFLPICQEIDQLHLHCSLAHKTENVYNLGDF